MTDNTPAMEYVQLGKTGLRVSKICVGCMSFGTSTWMDWVLDEEQSLDLLGKAYAAGINFFDTADRYSNGVSEKTLGKAIKQFNMPRGRIVVATKGFCAVPPEDDDSGINVPYPYEDPTYVNQCGLSRKHLFEAVDASLERLGLDYIDLYQIHRADPFTPWEETMEALHDIVKSGKVRYIGASSMQAYEFQKANAIADKHGWTKFVSMQNLYNLMYREEEREMIPYCVDQGIAIVNWSPLARGLLAGNHRGTKREENSQTVMKRLATTGRPEENQAVLDQVIKLAEKRGTTPAKIALAWVYSKPFVTAPIIGFSKEKYLTEAIEALAIKLTDEEIQALEAAYAPCFAAVYNTYTPANVRK
ncbi:NADP-dependent oxidoreductase domain-containing protein [Absidia repens]|uniref:NADP-dependent oxidoreductase domain-containing protein n=1 Tax=Absidia repens TaxID=90262 RepID=A0A1X2I036_9FUNG|nr:NADP-dependent oxidoreductase domain-containing protein [Absidia repens]